ncbi:hypothetical protein, partial [[Eubacterium] cellulosolvens]
WADVADRVELGQIMRALARSKWSWRGMWASATGFSSARKQELKGVPGVLAGNEGTVMRAAVLGGLSAGVAGRWIDVVVAGFAGVAARSWFRVFPQFKRHGYLVY